VAAPRAAASAPAQPAADAAAADKLTKLTDAVAQATRTSQQAAQIRLAAWQAKQHEPQLEVQLAAMPPATSGLLLQLRLAVAAAAAGLTTTIGLGMIAVGAAIVPTINSAAQAQAALKVPVVGIVPQTDRIRRARVGRLSLLRLLWIGTGLIVTFSCLAVMLMNRG
jgi:hypothetical protein